MNKILKLTDLFKYVYLGDVFCLKYCLLIF